MFTLLLLMMAAVVRGQTYSESPSDSTSASNEWFNPSRDDFHCPSELRHIFGHNIGDEKNIYEEEMGPIEGTDAGSERYRYRVTMKAENHANSTSIDDVVDSDTPMNNTAYKAGLQYVIDNMFTDKSAVSNVSRDMAIQLLTYGSGYVTSFEIHVDNRTLIVIIAFTFNTDQITSYLTALNIAIPEPFLHGVYVDYDHSRHETRIFGTAVGLELFFDHATGEFVQFITPQVAVALIDAVVPYCTRDYANEDGDVVSMTDVITGNHILKNKRVPVVLKLASAFYNDTVFVDFDDVFEESDFNNGNNSAIVDEMFIPNMDFRMGNGVDDTGIRGALPIMDSLYVTFRTSIHAFRSDWLAKLPGKGRFLFNVYACSTNCPHSATHFLDNDPDFSMNEIIPPAYRKSFTTASYEDITSPVYTDLFSKVPDAIFGKNGDTYEIYSGHNYSISAGIGIFIEALQIGEDLTTNLITFVQFNHERAETLYNALHPASQQYISAHTGIDERRMGVYVDMREAPLRFKVSSATTGMSFFADPPEINATGIPGTFIPATVLISFAAGDDVVMENGVRIDDTSGYEITNTILNGRGGEANFRFVVTGINNDSLSHVPTDQIPFGLTHAGDYMRISVADPINKPLEVVVDGMFHALEFPYAQNVNATILCKAKRCSAPFADKYGKRKEQSDNGIDGFIVTYAVIAVVIAAFVFMVPPWA